MKTDDGWQMISQSAEYALRAVLHLAGGSGSGRRSAAEVAAALGIPDRYLASVLNDLAHAGIVASARGRHGGFGLARPAESLTLAEVIAPFRTQRPPQRPCLLHDRPCGRGEPCVAHARWMGMAASVSDFFNRTTVADLLHEPTGPRTPEGAVA